MTTHWPRHKYREDVLRWSWWLHTILVVVWGMECDRRWLGGILAQSASRQWGKIRTPKVPIMARKFHRVHGMTPEQTRSAE